MRRSRHRRDLLPALACDARKTRCYQRCRDLRYPVSLSRCLGPRRRPHAAWFADRIETGGFCVSGEELLPRRIFPPALGAQRTGRAFAAAITPRMLRTTFAEIAGVGVFADQVDQPCPAKFIRELPCAGLVEPHQR